MFFAKGQTMADRYTTTQISEILEKTPQTIRNWTDEFSEYLSPLATQEGRNKLYTLDDLAVLSFIKDMRESGFRPEEIGSALARGDRSEIDVEDLSVALRNTEATTNPTKLIVELQMAQRKIDSLSTELETVRKELEMSRKLREDYIRLETEMNYVRAHYEERLQEINRQHEQRLKDKESQISQSAQLYVDLLKSYQEQIKQKDQEIRDLLEKLGNERERVGRYYARGREEGLRRQKSNFDEDE